MDFQAGLGTTNPNIKSVFRGLSDEMQKCIENCASSHQVCEQTLAYCLTKEGGHVEPRHLKALIDCAQICAVSADFMSRDSKIHSYTCHACAEACLACAKMCDGFSDDETMKLCADVCRRCEESCRKMASQNH